MKYSLSEKLNHFSELRSYYVHTSHPKAEITHFHPIVKV